MSSKSPIQRLSNEILDSIFIACEGCILTLTTLSQVCRQWYNISKRPIVWRCLKMDNIRQYAYYKRFLLSEQNADKCKAVHTLIISKPNESRHTHIMSLPLERLCHVERFKTYNLCLTEIEFMCQQLEQGNSRPENIEKRAKLSSINCKNIDTWCDTTHFSFDILKEHTELNEVLIEFMEDGSSGFASIHSSHESDDDLIDLIPTIRSLTLTSIRDMESISQRDILHSMEEVENDREEVFTQEDINQIEQKKARLMNDWHHLEANLLRKYKYFASLNHLEHLAFGACTAWTPAIWREAFQKVIMASPELKSLELHGWDQLGEMGRAGSRSSTIQPVRADAEEAIAECFELMTNLTRLRLVDFSIGPGLFKAGVSISKTLEHLEVVFSKSFVRYFAEPADVWLLIGPLKEFILSAFPIKETTATRTVNIYLHTELLHEIKHNQYFKNEPFLQSMEEILSGNNVNVSLNEIRHL